MFIDFENKNKINFAKGLRVPQGLYVEDNLILTAEHGPRGGDEINKIEYKKLWMAYSFLWRTLW